MKQPAVHFVWTSSDGTENRQMSGGVYLAILKYLSGLRKAMANLLSSTGSIVTAKTKNLILSHINIKNVSKKDWIMVDR